jgi:hypothetical protein
MIPNIVILLISFFIFVQWKSLYFSAQTRGKNNATLESLDAFLECFWYCFEFNLYFHWNLSCRSFFNHMHFFPCYHILDFDGTQGHRWWAWSLSAGVGRVAGAPMNREGLVCAGEGFPSGALFLRCRCMRVEYASTSSPCTTLILLSCRIIQRLTRTMERCSFFGPS